MNLPVIPTEFKAEVEVQYYYSSYICNFLKCAFLARFRTDGIYDKGVKILAEYKLHGDLLNQTFLVRCVCQVLCYIKNIENSGEKLPDVIFIANEFGFVIFDSSNLSIYLKYIHNDMIPSMIFNSPPQQLQSLLYKNLNLHKYKITDLPLLGNILNNYKNKSVGLKMTINDDNITRIFENFITSKIVLSKLSENEKVALFASIIFGECDDIVDKPSQIVTPLEDHKIVKINRNNYDAFLFSIKSINKPSRKRDITAQADRLIEEVSRRFHGEFYTPKVWVDEAHKTIENLIGINWKDDFIVWDPASGLSNLTRDYIFKELYCSTLHQSDIDIVKQRDYNKGAVKFQYDFLNDDVYPEGRPTFEENKLSKHAPKLYAPDKPVGFIQNPPLKHSGSIMGKEKLKGSGFTTEMTAELLKGTLGGNAGNIVKERSCHFIYQNAIRILKIKNDNSFIGTFLNTNILTKSTFFELRKWLYINGFDFLGGFCFQASQFSNVKDNWGMSFLIFQYHRNNQGRSCENFSDVYILQKKDIKDLEKTETIVYQGVQNLIVEWPRSIIKDLPEILVPSLTSAIKPTGMLGKVKNGCLGYLARSRANNWVMCSTVWVVSGTTVTPQNFKECCAVFTAGSIIPSDWIYEAKEILIPNMNHLEYIQWNNDAIIYSIFGSEQSSLRNIQTKGFWSEVKKGNFDYKFHNIQNQFFWMPHDVILNLADDFGFDDLYQDAITFNQERFVFKELQTLQLSSDAKELLDKASDLVKNSIKERKRLHELNPHWHLHAWDAGWYQIKLILKKYFKDDLKEFNLLYKVFEDRMREGVYKFGFLK